MEEENKKFIVYVAKYALTKGVYEYEAVHSSVDGIVKGATFQTRFDSLFLGKECFMTLEEANRKAEQMRLNRIKALRKELAKLEETKFV